MHKADNQSIEDIENTLLEKCRWCNGTGSLGAGIRFCHWCYGTSLACNILNRYVNESDPEHQKRFQAAKLKDAEGERPPWKIIF